MALTEESLLVYASGNRDKEYVSWKHFPLKNPKSFFLLNKAGRITLAFNLFMCWVALDRQWCSAPLFSVLEVTSLT